MKALVVFLSLLLFTQFAMADKPISYSGRVMDLSDVAIENPVTMFTVKITNATTCVLYAEQFSVDMTNSNGYFKIVLGSGSISFAPVAIDIFRPKTYVCQDGSSWSASPSDVRKISFSVKVGDEPWVNFSEDVINAVAYANDAEYLKGKSATDFIQIGANTTQEKIDILASQTSNILDLINGTNNVYAKQTFIDTALSTKQNSLTYSPINPANNLSELTSPSTARSNLGLGTLAIRNSITDLDISSVAWSKITGSPTTFPPSAHTHALSDVTNLNSSLNNKVDKFSYTCSTTQNLQYSSVTDSFSCVDISTGGDLSGNIGTAVVNKIQGKQVSPVAPADGDILKYNALNSRWEPTTFNIPAVNPTGTRVGYVGSTAPEGWVLASGRTIGRSGSGATERASSDTRDLYVLLWENYSNTILPVSGGRGTTAILDFEAGKTIQLPDYRGRVAAGKDNMGGTAAGRLTTPVAGSTLGSSGGAETTSHSHSFSGTTGATGDYSRTDRGGRNDMDYTHPSHTHSFSGTTSAGTVQVVQPTIIENMIIKL